MNKIMIIVPGINFQENLFSEKVVFSHDIIPYQNDFKYICFSDDNDIVVNNCDIDDLIELDSYVIESSYLKQCAHDSNKYIQKSIYVFKYIKHFTKKEEYFNSVHNDNIIKLSKRELILWIQK